MIEGYRRPDGSFGIRNHLAVIPTVVCSSEVASRISEQVPKAVSLPHHSGCGSGGDDIEKTTRTLAGLGKSPNVGGVLVVGLGCEQVDPYEVSKRIGKSGKEVETLVIQEEGGVKKTISKGVELIKKMDRELSDLEKEEGEVGELSLAVECGGSDAISGVTANPAVGYAGDLLIEEGGSVIISETSELIGGEHILAERAKDQETAENLKDVVEEVENIYKMFGEDTRRITPGNIEGGLTTLEEKSLGCIAKAGTSTLMEVVKYGEKPSEDGLIVMDTPGYDVPSMSGMVAGGAQLVAFTTGRGSIVGFPLAPVIKISSNPETFQKMKGDMDMNAGTIIQGEETVHEVGERIFDKIVSVANGEQTKSEALGLEEFAISSFAGAR